MQKIIDVFEKYWRLLLIILFVGIALLYFNRDYKEYGFYLEVEGEVIYLSDPFAGESRNILNLKSNLTVTDNSSFQIVFYFPEFKPERLNIYASPAWKLIQGVPEAKSNNVQPYHLRLQKSGTKKYVLRSIDLPEGLLFSMVYQPPRGSYFYTALGRAKFSELIIDALVLDDDSKLQQRFAQSLIRSFPEDHEFYYAAEEFNVKSARDKEYRLYQAALHDKSEYQRRTKLEKFIREYPRSKYRSRAETALLDVKNHRSSGTNERSTYSKPVASKGILESLVRRYVIAINTGDYAKARSLATYRAASNVRRYERSKKILDSKNYNGFSQRDSSATLTVSEGKHTNFVHKNGSWLISNY